jgi:dihydroneopterin aldolase
MHNNKGFKVHIHGLEVMARHGVLPQEQEKEQLFVFDVAMFVASPAAGSSDELKDTVSYDDICRLVTETASADSYRLLERLAAVTADAILAAFPAVEKVFIKVHKPDAPLEQMVSDVSVSLRRERDR